MPSDGAEDGSKNIRGKERRAVIGQSQTAGKKSNLAVILGI